MCASSKRSSARHGRREAAMNIHTSNFRASRRNVLKGGGALIVSFSFSGAIDGALAQGAAAAKPLALTEVDAFLAVDDEGEVTDYSGRVDRGDYMRQVRRHY